MNEDRFKFRAGFIHPISNKIVIHEIKHLFMDADTPIMQSTGLRDKNGVLIFEGDIVEFSVENPRTYMGLTVGEIKYSDYYAGFCMEGKVNENISHITIGYGNYNAHPGTLLVIGNVYEHPELLEKGND